MTVFDEDLRLLFWNDHIYDISACRRERFIEDLIRYPASGRRMGRVTRRTGLGAGRSCAGVRGASFERADDGRTLSMVTLPFRGRVSLS